MKNTTKTQIKKATGTLYAEVHNLGITKHPRQAEIDRIVAEHFAGHPYKALDQKAEICWCGENKAAHQ